ncbi:CotH kinase family protein [Streptomyces nanshensis]|uniref:Spore coat protein CotH n=1 Tax=Streptomyces nanshensis TaxID=518642 RepID=A0A1E7LCS5_9ACTN|nr:CotH kinase family protein [Streptomyces nanshensis]OEV13968.1 spore coat protein CotH [Streptomyces nanshensis]
MAVDAEARRRRRLRDRIPVRLRHHWKPATVLGAGLAAMVFFLGDARISPYVTSSSHIEADAITENVKGTVGLYDTSVSHSVQLTFQQTDFDKMMKEFKEDGTKDYIEADLTVDGVYLNDVGIRLKGNSTLSSLRGSRGMPGGGREMPEGAPQGAPAGASGGAAGGGRDRGQGQKAGRGPGGMIQFNLSEKKPEELPWLVKIDEFVEGRAYQGEREISLRPGSNGQVPLNEAVSLSLTRQSGQKAERYGLTKLRVNNRPTATRLMVESPDTDYADDIGKGVLYKAKAGGDFSYRGDDPTDYESSFKQVNKKGDQDLEPVMKLVKWADKASDKEFARDLDEYVDVDSLAAYLAAQNLLLNFDDMAGPGKNYLLWYDLETKKFSVLGWDYNLTFSGDATAGPDDTVSMGIPGGGAGGNGAGGKGAGGNGAGAQNGTKGGQGGAGRSQKNGGAGQGTPPGAGQNPPEGMPGGAGGGPGGGAGGGADQKAPGGKGTGGKGRGPSMQHPLKTKFLKSDAFDDVYKKAYRELYRKFFASGSAAGDLKDITAQARKAGAGSKELDTSVAKLGKTLRDRAAALAKDKEVTG